MPCYAADVLGRFLGVLLFAPAGILLVFAVSAHEAWFERHVVLPALYMPPPSATLPALRVAAAGLGLLLAFCAFFAARHATTASAARVGLACFLSVCASEPALRMLRRLLPETGVEGRLSSSDPKTGWAFLPSRTFDVAGGGRVVRYAIDAHGDRASSADWVEDPLASTVVITGESVATGHGLQWEESFAGLLASLLRVQVVNVAEGGYGNDQAHMRAVDALARLTHPLAVVSTFLPVQLSRNLRDDRPHMVLRKGALELVPASSSPLLLRQVLSNELPYLSERSLQQSLILTRAILHATAAAAHNRGAEVLFVVPSVGHAGSSETHAFIVRTVLEDLPHVEVRIDPAHVFPKDGHPDPEGARKIAAAIAEALHHAGTPLGSTSFTEDKFRALSGQRAESSP